MLTLFNVSTLLWAVVRNFARCVVTHTVVLMGGSTVEEKSITAATSASDGSHPQKVGFATTSRIADQLSGHDPSKWEMLL